ncbi:bifunctional 3,4-dihydroxy-2-butanone-4-phosphate synthase/GTP cyclohydrolase II [Mycobacterium sp. 141]|uniref:bifunctional 3,4-dihydroxy-2-butanone-4-phosphate synthase/GTP cyclohydrolase II n=1 Tax=Mycobacterium sp. 141 TaxID=1120797 RepID=UPI00037EF996|nr:bifunctional 3,4-dihydroxy-2-butanone-4-phosphate synthase/GTP cyclohydrolase II [Mycobacterium sp. 141]
MKKDDSIPNTRAVERAVERLAEGNVVIVTDNANRENEADLVCAAEDISTETMAFFVEHTSGIICVPMQRQRCEELLLPQMVETNTDVHGTAFTVSVDHVEAGTGVSAAARALTARALADPDTQAVQLRRPGHIFPLRARTGGTLERAGHTEAAVDLMKLAGRRPVAVISELVNRNGSMLAGHAVTEFAKEHDLPVISVDDLIEYRRHTESVVTSVTSVAAASLPTRYGTFEAIVYVDPDGDVEHLALVSRDRRGNVPASSPTLVRLHSECLTGDILGSRRCDCGTQLEHAAQQIFDEGSGVIIYLRGHEGRGIGLANKIRSYALQETGLDTIEANLVQGLPVDSRSYEVAAHILEDLGLSKIRLMTNNPQKVNALRQRGFDVEVVSVPCVPTTENARYLMTKRDKMGHSIRFDHTPQELVR